MRNLLLVIAVWFFFALVTYPQDIIKMYVFYTPSHNQLFTQWFLPSLTQEYELIIEYHGQECYSGNFMQDGWNDTMLRKVNLIIRAIEENLIETHPDGGNIFIHADIDIQFFGPTKEIICSFMHNRDMAIQRNRPNGALCAGFFACRANKKTLALWQAIRTAMIRNKTINDQVWLEYFLQKNNKFNISWTLLPIIFYGAGSITNCEWKPGEYLPIPKGILLHHANFTVGVDNKIAQLAYVKKRVEEINATA